MHTPNPRRTRALSGSAARCQATITFASGAKTTTRSAPMLILGTRRLTDLRYPKHINAHRRLPPVRFTTSAPGRIIVRVWCRATTTRRCATPTRPINTDTTPPTSRAAYTPPGLTKYRRLITLTTRATTTLNLNTLLPHGLPKGTYKITIRLAQRTTTGRHRTTTPLHTEFTTR
jgi:hypothetical protein